MRQNFTTSSAPGLAKARTGIEGIDEITRGGLPRGRTTLVEGGPGSGKTILALQSLVNGARLEKEPGIFVAFEESSQRIRANAATFGWDLTTLERGKLFFLDAQPGYDMIQAGSFDLGGMLAALEAKVREIKARRIVFDAIDILLVLLGDPAAARREVYRLHEWLIARELTAIITSKSADGAGLAMDSPETNFMPFMVDCAVALSHEVVAGVSERSLRVVKYRGSAYSENQSPFLIGDHGVEVASTPNMERTDSPISPERVSSGVARLDTMLGGGYYRGSTTLVTGFPGTAKSTLGGAFAEAACRRGERTLYVSFDSDANEVVRNLASVSIRLDRFIKKGLLRMVSARAASGSAETHLMRLKTLAREHRVRCLVIDPVSALAKLSAERNAHDVAERLIDWTKAAGITLVCTSLLDEAGPHLEGTPLQISTIADTWIHLSYQVQFGERNRAVSIIKSRGTAHSNQVRELVLRDTGVTLADAYTAGGEVLMGTLRWEREQTVRAEQEETAAAARRSQALLEVQEAELEARLKTLQRELQAKRAEKQAVNRHQATLAAQQGMDRKSMRKLRGEDAP